MKTLDEVIKAIDFCKSGDLSKCKDCPYICTCDSDYAVLSDDALHYLWEYRTEQQILRDRKEHYEYWEHKYYAELEKNDPLDWETLKTMEGKPVWVELTYPEGAYSHWGIIWGFPKAGYEFMELRGFHDIVSFSVMEKEQGKTWQAYRKERL